MEKFKNSRGQYYDIEGYLFEKNGKGSAGQIYCRCIDWKESECPVRATVSNGEVEVRNEPHSHGTHDDKKIKLNFNLELKERAKSRLVEGNKKVSP